MPTSAQPVAEAFVAGGWALPMLLADGKIYQDIEACATFAPKKSEVTAAKRPPKTPIAKRTIAAEPTLAAEGSPAVSAPIAVSAKLRSVQR